MVGDGPELEDCQRLVSELGIADTVVFMGGRENGACYFNGGDVGILLSIEPEAFGLVLLEAMSRGKAIVASRSGGIPEVVADGETGLLVDPLDSQAVADAISRLARSSELREKLGRAGLERWKSMFSVERMLQAYESHFGIGVNG